MELQKNKGEDVKEFMEHQGALKFAVCMMYECERGKRNEVFKCIARSAKRMYQNSTAFIDSVKETKEHLEKHTKPENDYYHTEHFECWDVIQELCRNKDPWEAVLFFNIFKYIWRYDKKNGVEDLKKAQDYLGRLIDGKVSDKKAD